MVFKLKTFDTFVLNKNGNHKTNQIKDNSNVQEFSQG